MVTQEEVFITFDFLLHEHIGLIVSSKICLNLWSFRRLNCSLRRLRSFTPTGL